MTLTVGPHVVSQQPFRCKTFGTVGTLEPLTYSTRTNTQSKGYSTVKLESFSLPLVILTDVTFHGALPYDVVKEFSVVSVHPPTAWTCHHFLLRVAAQVLPQLRTPFSRCFTI